MPENKNLQAVIFVATWVLVGLLSTVLFKWILDDLDGSLLAILLIAPIFIFIITSGQLSEFSAPGGWNAKFREAASKHITTGKDDVIEISKLNELAKLNREKLPEALRDLSKNPKSPIALKITLDEQERYGSIPLKMWIENFFLNQNFKLVIVVDKGGGYIGHISREYLVALIIQGHSRDYDSRQNHEENIDRIVDLINQGDVEGLKEQPFLISQRIFEGISNAKALEFMNEENLDFTVVVDSQNKVKGILEKDKIISKMLFLLIDE